MSDEVRHSRQLQRHASLQNGGIPVVAQEFFCSSMYRSGRGSLGNILWGNWLRLKGKTLCPKMEKKVPLTHLVYLYPLCCKLSSCTKSVLASWPSLDVSSVQLPKQNPKLQSLVIWEALDYLTHFQALTIWQQIWSCSCCCSAVCLTLFQQTRSLFGRHWRHLPCTLPRQALLMRSGTWHVISFQKTHTILGALKKHHKIDSQFSLSDLWRPKLWQRGNRLNLRRPS